MLHRPVRGVFDHDCGLTLEGFVRAQSFINDVFDVLVHGLRLFYHLLFVLIKLGG